MPLEYSYTERRGVFVVGTGEVSGKDLYRTNEKIYETPPSIESLAYQLWDLTGAHVAGLTPDVMEALASQDRQASRRHPKMVIAIAVKADLAFGYTRMWESSVSDEGIETHVCRSLDEAREWIDSTLGREAS